MKSAHYALRLLRRWHARLGVLAVIFFVLLAVSGIVLNHGGTFGLDGRKLHVAWLARWYGLKTDPLLRIFQAGSHVLAWGNGTWLLDGAVIAEDAAPPIGMVELPGALYIASADTILVYTNDHRLVEKIPAVALPATPITAIGVAEGEIELRARGEIFASADSVLWARRSGSNVAWSVGRPAPASLQHILAAQLTPAVPVLQLISDIHSGRVLGKRGPLLVDALGLLLITLGLSGAWVFLQSLSHRGHVAHRDHDPTHRRH